MRILLVEDDPGLRASLAEALHRDAYCVDAVERAESALQALGDATYDALLLDIGLPGMDGLSLLARLRAQALRMPVLLITARDDWSDKVRGLDLGADDYLAKPFMLPELLARLRALLRRSQASASGDITLGRLSLGVAEQTATLDGQPLTLTRKEWALLFELALSSPKIVTKRKLINSLSHWENELSANAIELHISRLRRKLAGSTLELETIRGLGYRLIDPPTAGGSADRCA